MIYFDNAATTPCDPRVVDAMLPYLSHLGGYGNVSSTHLLGQQSKQAVECAAEQVKECVAFQDGRVIWTSGATEANNLALFGIAHFYSQRGKHIISSTQEHLSVVEPLKQLVKQGFEVTWLKPQADGQIDCAELKAAIRPDTLMISLAHANSETGVIQDIQQIGDIAHAQGVLFHVDAAQSAGKISLEQNKISLLSLSAHKLYGPKGIGALVLTNQPKLHLQPLFYGGQQQGRYRPGTLPQAQIVGMGAAFAIAAQEMTQDNQRVKGLRDQFIAFFQNFDAVVHGQQVLPGHLNLRIPGILASDLLSACDTIAFSKGSACSASVTSPSYVLQAMGLSEAQAQESIRLSLGRFNTQHEVDEAQAIFTQAILENRAEKC